ncbi:MAG: metallophosphoesterase family protein [Chloroflexi bacterium]|nr:metallophosphoesterase family protein [Anaerolineaceae bacterium]NLI45303.1 metallophosphoesterase family protein [Chloroflexota bacterium]HOE35606.1 YfcE family phosphodiesterase [Anaerolineaceae bacterium]HOT25257.1 YfcE family phosphodiesterase [Anaerolineaceae bacterium]HQH57803.1 YfcE family phosphodiesterase [Anaerolineaceae bacterium]
MPFFQPPDPTLPPSDHRYIVISDTHVGDRVKKLDTRLVENFRAFRPEAILHAGDISSAEALQELEAISPVAAVQGNRDWLRRLKLPKEWRFEVNGVRVVLTHGHVSMWHYTLNYVRLLITGRKVNVRAFRDRLAQRYPEADLIIFGHTHFQLFEQVGNKQFLNPGAAYPHLLNHRQIQYCELTISADGQVQARNVSLPDRVHV